MWAGSGEQWAVPSRKDLTVPLYLAAAPQDGNGVLSPTEFIAAGLQQVWSETQKWDIISCVLPLTTVPVSRPGPRSRC